MRRSFVRRGNGRSEVSRAGAAYHANGSSCVVFVPPEVYGGAIGRFGIRPVYRITSSPAPTRPDYLSEPLNAWYEQTGAMHGLVRAWRRMIEAEETGNPRRLGLYQQLLNGRSATMPARRCSGMRTSPAIGS